MNVNSGNLPSKNIEDGKSSAMNDDPNSLFTSHHIAVVPEVGSSATIHATNTQVRASVNTSTSTSQRSDFLVSELEDNDVDVRVEEQDQEESRSGIIIGAKDAIDVTEDAQPMEIPPEPEIDEGNSAKEDDSDDESDYEYDDDENGQYSGFLISEPVLGISPGSAAIVPQDTALSARPDNIVEDEETSLGYEKNGVSESVAKAPPPSSKDFNVAQFARLETIAPIKKSKWKEPSKEAISMSLRVEKEKTGGRRRLAADLYKIMTNDTEESGFSIEPKSEDCMDTWTIRLFKFDEDSNLHKDMLILGLDHVELEMHFPEQYPFEPPFVCVVRPRFKRQTGFVMNGALCMELLTNDGWNPVNDIESVIVSIRSLLVVGDGRLQAVADMPKRKREALLAAHSNGNTDLIQSVGCNESTTTGKRKRDTNEKCNQGKPTYDAGHYSTAESKAAYSHLSNFHKKKGWSHWWAKKG